MWLCLIIIPLVVLLQVYNSFVLNILEIVYFLCILAMVFLVKLDVVNNVQLSLVMSISIFLFISILFFHMGLLLKSTRLAAFLRQIIVKVKNKWNIDEEIHRRSPRRNIPIMVVGLDSSDEEHEPQLKN